jgi:hypothetical protein
VSTMHRTALNARTAVSIAAELRLVVADVRDVIRSNRAVLAGRSFRWYRDQLEVERGGQATS